MSTSRKNLYERLPEFYRIKDQQQVPAGQLKAFVEIMDEVMAGMRDNVEELYHDFFIETCKSWVIPYIADLLGVSHLSGDPWTLRADTARTVFHRRRKGTLGAVESLTYSLSGWAAQAIEFRDRLVWNQHLNHQRPDAGGTPPLTFRTGIAGAIRGGTVTLRDPALLSFVNGPFDPFAHVVDVKPGTIGMPRYNLPNLGVFLWRLEDYQVKVTRPGQALADDATKGNAAAVVRCIVHPQNDPMVLFNTHRFHADDDPPELSHPDAVPGPIPWPRLSEGTPSGNPEAYVAVDHYSGATPQKPSDDSVGLVLHVPESVFPAGTPWKFRGANLCAWEEGLNPPLDENEIVIDPDLGRVLFGLADRVTQADALAPDLWVSYTYGFSGPTGAHPISRQATPGEYQGTVSTIIAVSTTGTSLTDALSNLGAQTGPLIIEIQDSAIHDLDLGAVTGVGDEGGDPALILARSLWIRAAGNERPVIRLQQPLRFRPADVLGPDALDNIANMEVVLEGLYITWDRNSAGFSGNEALVQQAALNRLMVDGCTLDPGGARILDGTPLGARQSFRDSMHLGNDYGFLDDPNETVSFDQKPQIILSRSIVGTLAIDDGYTLNLTDSIVDGGSGLEDTPANLAVRALTGDPEVEWGPDLEADGMTCLGRMRVTRVSGRGGIWLHRLEAHDDQYGCIKFSYFSGDGDRLPPHHGCVFGHEVDLHFTAEWFGQPGYGQLGLRSDRKILEQGPRRDAMGAFGYLLNTHKWKNINIRYREFIPVGIRPILIPVT